MHNTAPFRVQLLSAAAATTAVSAPFDCSQYTYLTVYYIGTGTLSAGAVTIEEADYLTSAEGGTDLGYAGTWSAMEAYTVTPITTAAQKATHFPAGAYRYVRARVSTTVTGGGTVSVVLVGR